MREVLVHVCVSFLWGKSVLFDLFRASFPSPVVGYPLTPLFTPRIVFCNFATHPVSLGVYQLTQPPVFELLELPTSERRNEDPEEVVLDDDRSIVATLSIWV